MGFPTGWCSIGALLPVAWSWRAILGEPTETDNVQKHRTLSLFTGIAGLDIALGAWCRAVAFVERSRLCRDILMARMEDGSLPRVPIHEDVRDLLEVGEVDGIVGGFPCVDTCVAGSRLGLDGDESSLVLHVFRLCDVTRCGFVLLENVIGVRSMPSVWRRVLSEFLARGFACNWVSLAASQVGAPQRRRRWFLLARRGRYIRISLTGDRRDAEAPPLPSSPLQWNGGRPPPSDWLTASPYSTVREPLAALGNVVVPLQGHWAAILLSQGADFE